MSLSRRLVLVFAGAAGATGLAACGPGGPTGANGKPGDTGGTMAVALSAEPATLDPQVTSDGALAQAAPFLFDTLVYRETDGRFTPHLAERWETAADGKSVTFTLRGGLRFHDDSPLDAAAVVQSFRRLLQVGAKSPILADLKRVANMEASAPNTIRFSFADPSATFFNAISQPYAGIVSPAAAQRLGEGFGRAPVGSGPFTFKEWRAGTEIALGRNPAYAWGPSPAKNKQAPYLDGLRLRILPDVSAQIAALRAGELDVAYIADGAAAKQLESDKAVQLLSTNIQGLIYLGFNMRRAPVDQLAVRQAIASAVNKKELAEVAMEGTAVPVAAPLPPSIMATRPEVAKLERTFDLAATKQALAAAGYKPGAGGLVEKDGKPLQLTLLTSTSATNGALATLLQAQLKAAGIDVKVQQLESTAVLAATPRGEFDLLLWRYDWKDPNALALFLQSDKIGAGNRVFYSNPKLDALLDRGETELDQEKRARIYTEAQQIVLADLPWHPLVTPVSKTAIRGDRVKGVRVELQGKLLLADARVVSAK